MPRFELIFLRLKQEKLNAGNAITKDFVSRVRKEKYEGIHKTD